MNHIFDPTPGTEFQYYLPMIILSATLIIGGIAFSLYYNNRKKSDIAFKKLFRRTGNHLFWVGFVFGVLLLIRYENIPYFAMRLWLYLGFAGLIYVLYRNVKKYKVDYPKMKKSIESKVSAKNKTKKRTYTTKKRRK